MNAPKVAHTAPNLTATPSRPSPPQTLEIAVRDSHLTGRVEVGSASVPLSRIIREGGRINLWVPLRPPPAYLKPAAAAGGGAGGNGVPQPVFEGEVLLELTYKVGFGGWGGGSGWATGDVWACVGRGAWGLRLCCSAADAAGS